jgi:hypothetical protein
VAWNQQLAIRESDAVIRLESAIDAVSHLLATASAGEAILPVDDGQRHWVKVEWRELEDAAEPHQSASEIVASEVRDEVVIREIRREVSK